VARSVAHRREEAALDVDAGVGVERRLDVAQAAGDAGVVDGDDLEGGVEQLRDDLAQAVGARVGELDRGAA